MKNQLDFVVIGAQKSGTTTLFKLLQQHPKIYIPPEKEAPFFNYKDRESLGWNWYIQEFFGAAAPQKLWGTVTPQYMCYKGIAAKLYKMNPDVKIIAILRNPLERALSHYNMSKKRGLETRSFNEAIVQLSTSENLLIARETPNETNAYVVWGEYGRILQEYKNQFPLKQILILTNDELETKPAEVIKQVFDFLNVEAIIPEGLGIKYHAGSDEPKLHFIKKIRNSNILKKIWYLLVPFKMRRRFIYWFDQWNTKKIKTSSIIKEQPDNAVMHTLMLHYRNDVELLKQNFGVSVNLDVNKMNNA